MRDKLDPPKLASSVFAGLSLWNYMGEIVVAFNAFKTTEKQNQSGQSEAKCDLRAQFL